jgi:hypothetical protein
MSFEIVDFVYLKVSPMRGLRHFKVRGKLIPRSIGPFKILEKRGELDYYAFNDAHDGVIDRVHERDV